MINEIFITPIKTNAKTCIKTKIFDIRVVKVNSVALSIKQYVKDWLGFAIAIYTIHQLWTDFLWPNL